MELKPGDNLGDRYQLLSKAGEGGMGEVWKARDTKLDRDVALKVSKAEFTARFDREARAIAALNHSNICTLHDVGPNYLVMEYIRGTPLKGPLPLDQAIRYAAQICDALDAAHRKGNHPPRSETGEHPGDQSRFAVQLSSCSTSAWQRLARWSRWTRKSPVWR